MLLGGMMCDERVWQAQVEALGGEFNTITVANLTRADTIEAMARDALRNVSQHFMVAGLSLGGIVAFEIWRRAPERVTHLALIDTNPFAEQPARQVRRQDEIDRATRGELRSMMIDEFKPAYLGARARNDKRLLNAILAMAVDLGPEVFDRQSRALRKRPDSDATLPSITIPAAVICGAEDELCPVAYHEHMAGHLPNAELFVLPGCGHLAPMESPAAVNDVLRQLIKK